jgi:hypothetical protein
MKLAQGLLFAFISVSGISVMADVQPIKPNTEQSKVAALANDIFSVTNLKLGKYAYKIVDMDSKLNGDLTATTIILVGEGGVGGLAGYEASFQLSPTDDIRALISASIENGEIALTFSSRIDGGTIMKFVHYDATSGTLKERLGK